MANIQKGRMDPGLSAVLAVSLIFFSAFFSVSVIRYNTLQYHDWDFALNANAMWNIVHGNPYIGIYERPFLGNHFNVIAFLIAPIYFVFQTPLTLLFLKTLALSLVSAPIYLISRRFFSSAISALFSILYLAYPALLYVILYEFHFEDFAPFFLALSFFFLIVNKKPGCFLFAALAALCKENVPLVVSAMGLYACFFRPHRRLTGAVLFMASGLYFLAVTLYLQPLFTPDAGGAGYAYHYGIYGKNFLDVFLFILTHPLKIIRDLFAQEFNLLLFADIFSPLSYLPLLRPDILFIILPTILKNMLSRDWTAHTIYWHYAATIIPFLIISLIFAFKKLAKSGLVKRFLPVFLAAILFVELLKGYNFYRVSHHFVKFHLIPTAEDAAKQNAVSLVKDTSSIIATFDFLPKVSQRKDVYTFYMLWKQGPQYGKIPETDYALIDFNDFFVEKFFNLAPAKTFETFKNYALGEGWGTPYAKGEIVLFKKGFLSKEKILTLEKFQTASAKKPYLIVDNSLELLDLSITPDYSSGTMRLTFTWHLSGKKSQSLYKILFFASGGKKEFIFAGHSIGYKYLTNTLGQDEVLKENYYLILPPVKNAKYTYSFAFLDVTNRRLAKILPLDKVILDKHERVIIKEKE